MATNKVAVTSVWDELTSKYNKAAEELGCTADFGKDPRLSQLTKVAFALATHTIPKRGVSAPGAREEKWEKRFKESLLVIQDIVGNSSSTPAGSWDETAKIWLTWAFHKEVLQRAGAPGQLCKYLAYRGIPFSKGTQSKGLQRSPAVLPSLALLSFLLKEPTFEGLRQMLGELYRPWEVIPCLDISAVQVSLNLLVHKRGAEWTQHRHCASEFLAEVVNASDRIGASALFKEALKHPGVMDAFAESLALAKPIPDSDVIVFFSKCMSGTISNLEDTESEEACFLSSLLRFRGSSPFIAALQRYRVHLHRTPSPPERSFCQLFLAFINNAWRHELGHPNQSHGSVDFYLMLRSSEAWRNCPAWSPELLEAHLALLTQHPFLITSQPDSFVLYPPKQQLEAARHLAAHPFAVRALGLAAFSPSVTEFLRTQSDPAEALLFKPITPDVQAIMDLYSTVGSVLLFFCDLLRCSEGGSSHETLRKSVLPCLGDGMRNVMSMFLVVITKPSYPESSAPMLPNGFNMREWQAVALVALELDEADCPPDVRENVSYLKSFLRQESFLASGAGKLVKSKGLLWQADAASQQQAQPDRQQQAPAMPASNESNARSSSPKPGGSTSSTMADKLQALTLGNDGQKGNSSTAQSADSGSSGEIARGEAARRGKERVCGQCGRLARDLKMCSGCRRKWFCGAECSEKAWPVRRTDCKAAAKLKK
ncbi:hypothetical protein DUNSADRAFT_1842 [Dunaliella salina]|uniref:MYND-type domain-containing protein n=1 Tax=Dunaliella salina TaxID=3046 RepID=A0ABQ7GWJ7_DUNSA|nr:hypothetical protein DUNSADRAFT_1842 [Dunaliella salina]|eukprot:KAF5838975.1 hypothetical protein DUNSADRAFT_1842 [Dunaliella salina]